MPAAVVLPLWVVWCVLSVFAALLIAVLRYSLKFDAILIELLNVQDALNELEPLIEEACERRQYEMEREMEREFPNPLYEKMKREGREG